MSQDSQIAEVTHVVSKAFKDFNASVGAVSEVVDEEFGDEQIGPIVLQGWVHTVVHTSPSRARQLWKPTQKSIPTTSALLPTACAPLSSSWGKEYRPQP